MGEYGQCESRATWVHDQCESRATLVVSTEKHDCMGCGGGK